MEFASKMWFRREPSTSSYREKKSLISFSNFRFGEKSILWLCSKEFSAFARWLMKFFGRENSWCWCQPLTVLLPPRTTCTPRTWWLTNSCAIRSWLECAAACQTRTKHRHHTIPAPPHPSRLGVFMRYRHGFLPFSMLKISNTTLAAL